MRAAPSYKTFVTSHVEATEGTWEGCEESFEVDVLHVDAEVDEGIESPPELGHRALAEERVAVELHAAELRGERHHRLQKLWVVPESPLEHAGPIQDEGVVVRQLGGEEELFTEVGRVASDEAELLKARQNE